MDAHVDPLTCSCTSPDALCIPPRTLTQQVLVESLPPSGAPSGRRDRALSSSSCGSGGPGTHTPPRDMSLDGSDCEGDTLSWPLMYNLHVNTSSTPSTGTEL